MATVFTITDGTTTVFLNNGTSCIIEEYNQTQQADSDAAGLSVDYAVSESMDLLIFGVSIAGVRTVMRSIEILLEAAKRRSTTGVGARIYIQAQLEGDTQTWQTEIFDGQLISERIADQIWRGKVEASLTFVRSRIWEGQEAEVQISAYSQVAATGGRNILNNGTDSWIEIASSQIDGTAPALAHLRLQNLTGGTRRVEKVFIGNNAFATPSTFGNIIQGESYVLGYGTSTSNGTSSNGQVVYASLNTTKSVKFMWRFTTAQMGAGGRWFRVVIRVPNENDLPSPGVFTRLSIRDYDGLITLWQSGVDIFLPTGKNLFDIGPVPIPPGDYGTDYSQAVLVMEAWLGSGTANFYIDYLALMGIDGYRVLESAGCELPANQYIDIDESNRRYTWMNGSSQKTPIFAPYGSPLVLYPGQTQRIYIVHGENASYVADMFKAQLWYKPARFTV